MYTRRACSDNAITVLHEFHSGNTITIAGYGNNYTAVYSTILLYYSSRVLRWRDTGRRYAILIYTGSYRKIQFNVIHYNFFIVMS